MIEQWQILAHHATGDGPHLPDTCVWEIELGPYHFQTCGLPLTGDAEYLCSLHDADAAETGLIDADDHEYQQARAESWYCA